MAKQKAKPLWTVDEDQIVQADKSQSISGAHIVEIIEAVTNTTNSGARWIQFTIAIPDRVDAEGNPKEYGIRRWYITSGKDKGKKDTFRMNILNSLFYLTKTKPVIGKAKAVVWEDGVQVEKKVDQFIELRGKKVGAVVQKEYRWRRKKINGYTKEEKSFEDVSEPTDVWIDNYDKEPRLSFDITRFFMHKGDYKGWVASEMVKDKKSDEKVKPQKLKKALDRIRTYEFDDFGNPVLKKMNDEKMYDYITKELKKKLGKDFDKDLVERYKGTELEEADDVPF